MDEINEISLKFTKEEILLLWEQMEYELKVFQGKVSLPEFPPIRIPFILQHGKNCSNG